MIEYGSLVELSDDVMRSWNGPAHWVSLQPLLKLDSVTTPTRLVTNSSLTDRNENSVNSILMKGLNSCQIKEQLCLNGDAMSMHCPQMLKKHTTV